MNELPKEGRSQEIGRLAGRAIGIKLPKAWIEKELDGDTDFGIDYIIQLKSSVSEVSASFYLQLKGTTNPNYSTDDDFISYPFKAKTLKFYHRQEPAVMVAVVDLKGNEDELWNCPIYYLWLEDSWFFDNKDKLNQQDRIAVKIPKSNLLIPSLDIFDYYDKRINEKLKVAELKREIEPYSQNIAKSLEDIANAISEKPILLKAVEKRGDEPWLVNPNGETPTKLKLCSEYLNSNQIDSADDLLVNLYSSFRELTSHEKAEYFYQKATLLSLETNFNEATECFKKALQYSTKDRYKIAFLESKFKLPEIPDAEELQNIANSLNDDSIGNALIKCKCLALLGKSNEAINILKTKHSSQVIGQLVILTLIGNDEELDQLLEITNEDSLDKDRDKYSFHALAARRAYVKATTNEFTYDEFMPIQGKTTFDVQLLKKALYHVEKAWNFARKIGYPSDITILLDISALIFSYFNKVDILFYHFEEILKQRPHSVDLIKQYAVLAFNKGLYDKTISLLESQTIKYDSDDYGLLILSYYYLGKPRIAINYLRDAESQLLKEKPKNIALLFCVGSELAQKQMEVELADRYLNLVKGFDNGESILAIHSFINDSNQNPNLRGQYCDELYVEYLRLNKPVEIAEQLFRYLNPNDNNHAQRICELADCILSSHELLEKDYFRLAKAYITTSQYESALSVAEKHIDREIYDPYWAIIQTVCYHNLGRLGLAHDVIKMAVQKNPFSPEYYHYYANICIKLGLIDEIENALFDILAASTEREHKLSILTNLISILSSKPNYSDKTTTAIRQFGNLVDQNNMNEEGQFLILFLAAAKTEDKIEIAAFQKRLEKYTSSFPDSPFLKQGHIDVEGDADSLIASIHKIAGITDELVAKWEQNKLMIKNGSLPVPFVLLERFLSNTRDIFSSWILSLNSTDGDLEFKINHAPQLDMKAFELEFTPSRIVIIEDTTLLISYELQILDVFLDKVSEFCLLSSTFERFSKNSHPIAGSIHWDLAKNILATINKFKSKMIIFPDEETELVDSYVNAINKHDAFFIVDDFNMLRMVNLSNKAQVISANIFNIIEILYDQNHIHLEDKFSLVYKASSLGLRIPNMTIGLLAETLAFHSRTLYETDFLETEFKVIFDKIFTASRNSEESIELFLKMLCFAINRYNMSLQPLPILTLLRSFLLRHCYKDLESFMAFIFVYLTLTTPVTIEYQLISTSKKHVDLWKLYQDIQLIITDGNASTKEILLGVVQQLFMLQEKSRLLAYHNIKHCFVPMTELSVVFEKTYQEFSLHRRLFYS